MQALGKRGESTIIGYVLLIVLAIGMASAVYAFLKFYIPKDQPSCPPDTNLAIERVRCENERITVELRNRGLFSIDGAYVKIGQSGRAFKQTLNCPDNTQLLPPACEIYFTTGVPPYSPQKLSPGILFNRTYAYVAGPGTYELEVQPIVMVETKPTLCENSLIVQEVECT